MEFSGQKYYREIEYMIVLPKQNGCRSGVSGVFEDTISNITTVFQDGGFDGERAVAEVRSANDA